MPSTDKLNQHLRRTQTAVNEGHLEEGVDYALQGLKAARELGRPARSDTFIRILRILLKGIENETAKPGGVSNHACSCCGRSEDQVKLLVGADGAICSECASQASDFFKKT